MEECDLYSGICHECTDRAAEQRGERRRKVSSPILIWAGRIGHVLLSALVCAPLGVLGLGIVGILGVLALARFWTPLAAVYMIVWHPVELLTGWFLSGPGWLPTGDTGDDEFLHSEGWKAFPIFLATIGLLVFCYYLDGWRGVLIGGGAVGALIGAVLSILSQWPKQAKVHNPRP
jgi:hypothetical protein